MGDGSAAHHGKKHRQDGPIGFVDTAGRALFRRAVTRLHARGWTNAQIADRLDISTHTLASWSRGVRRPDHAARLCIQIALGVPAVSWLTDDERESAASTEKRLKSLRDAV